MRPILCLLKGVCLLMLTLPASADDSRLPPPPPPISPGGAPSFTFPQPMNSSSGSGIIMGDDLSLPGSYPGWAPNYVPGRPFIAPAPVVGEPIAQKLQRRSNQVTIDQFQSSSYWTPPQPFNPAGALNYSHGLAGASGIHVRYPYFNYRSPWTYQGPAGISHTIEWSGWRGW